VRLCVESGLAGIEWGGDIHAPHGDTARAREVGEMTRDNGLAVAAYGSYYRAGHDEVDFDAVLESALAMQASLVRVWAGRRSSDDSDAAYRETVTEDLRSICEKCLREGIKVATEWHGRTLTDTAESARALFRQVNHPNLRTYWQPRAGGTPEDCLRDMQAALPHLAGVHVFHWRPQSGERLPLADGENIWPEYLAGAAGNTDGYALLEYVRDDDPAQLARDALVLRRWLS